MTNHIQFLNLTPLWRLGLTRVTDDDDFDLTVGWWLNGRLWGRYVSYFLWRRRD